MVRNLRGTRDGTEVNHVVQGNDLNCYILCPHHHCFIFIHLLIITGSAQGLLLTLQPGITPNKGQESRSGTEDGSQAYLYYLSFSIVLSPHSQLFFLFV